MERAARKQRRAVEKAFRGGKANRDWKGSYTAKKYPKQKPKGGCALIVLAVIGSGAMAALGTMRGWL